MAHDGWQPPPGWGPEPVEGQPPARKPLHRKKRVVLPAALLGLIVLGGSLGEPAPAPAQAISTLSAAGPGAPQRLDDTAAVEAAEDAAREAAEAAQRAAADRAAAEKALKKAAADRAAAEKAAAEAAAAKVAARKAAAAQAAQVKRQAAAARQAAITRKAEAAAARAGEQRREAASSSTGSTDTYTNVDGDQVQRPTHAAGRPSGSSAQCRDGTYSFSRHRSGTCSGHGGVATWF